MRRFTGHREAWGDFVDVKVNAPELLEGEILRKPVGRVWVSGVCDPYQPLEARYNLTGRCLGILVRHGWPIAVQTRSPLVLRDIELLRGATDAGVTLSVPTADDAIRRIFEPNAPAIGRRIDALAELHRAGIPTTAMIAPILPGAEGLVAALAGKVDRVLVDRLNYSHADWVYRKHHLGQAMTDGFFIAKGRELRNGFARIGIDCEILFAGEG
jgi:DNA repair photolyase